MAVKHAKVSAVADGDDANLVQPSDWNASHTIEDGTITAAMLADTGVTAGSYTNVNLTVDAQGRITAAASGAGGGGGITNSAGANVIPKSDGTNLVASSWTDNGTTSTTTGAVAINGNLTAGTTTANAHTVNGKLTIVSAGGTSIFGNSSSEAFRTPVSKSVILGASVFNYQLDANKTFIRGGATTSAVVIGDTATSATVEIANSTAQTNVLGALNVAGNVGFYGTTPAAKPSVTGSRGGNAALASLLTALASLGLITDNTTA